MTRALIYRPLTTVYSLQYYFVLTPSLYTVTTCDSPNCPSIIGLTLQRVGPLAAFFVAHFVVNGADVKLAASVSSTYNRSLHTICPHAYCYVTLAVTMAPLPPPVESYASTGLDVVADVADGDEYG